MSVIEIVLTERYYYIDIDRRLVAHVSGSNEEAWKGYLYAFVLFATAIIQSILNANSAKRTMMVGMRIRTVLSNAVFKKALVISNAAKRGRVLIYASEY